MKKCLLLAVAFLLVVSSMSYAGTVNEAGMSWYDDVDEAKAVAAKEGKLIYIYFTGGVRCGWCVKMKKETFSNADVQTKVLKKVVIVMLNVWENPKQKDKDLMTKHGGRGVPFNVVLDKDLGLVSKFSGYKPAEDFIETMEKIITSYGEVNKLEKLVETKDGRNYDNFFKLCKAYYDMGKLDKAGEVAAKLVKNDEENKHENNAELNLILAESLLAELNGKSAEEVETELTKAKGFLAKAKELDSKNKGGHLEKAVRIEMALLLNMKKFDDVIKLYKESFKEGFKFKNKQEVLQVLAVAHYYKQDMENFKKLLTEIKEIDPKSNLGKWAEGLLKRFEGK